MLNRSFDLPDLVTCAQIHHNEPQGPQHAASAEHRTSCPGGAFLPTLGGSFLRVETFLAIVPSSSFRVRVSCSPSMAGQAVVFDPGTVALGGGVLILALVVEKWRPSRLSTVAARHRATKI